MTQRISSQLYDSPGGKLLLDMTDRVQGARFATNERGYLDWSGFVPMEPDEAFGYYDLTTGHFVVSDGAAVLFHGRVEDPEANGDPTQGPTGLKLTCYGYQRAMSDIKLPVLYSTMRLDDWSEVTIDHLAARYPERYDFSFDGALRIAPLKGDNYDNTHIGSMTFAIPHLSTRQIVSVVFDYDVKLQTTWKASLSRYTDAFTFQSEVWAVNGNGASQTGTATLSITGCDRIILNCLYNSAITITNIAEAGDWYVKVYNLRVKTTTGTVYVGDIAADLVSYVDGINPAQISADTSAIRSSGFDLKEAMFLDMTPSQILDQLCLKGDSAGNIWEWKVWEGQRLRVQPRGTGAQTWYIDEAPRLTRSLEGIVNSGYAVYTDANGRERRTAVNFSPSSVNSFAITRREAISADTTNATDAALIRDTFITDSKFNGSLGEFEVKHLRTSDGAIVPGWYCRSGDTIVIRGYPAGSALALDYIRVLMVFGTEFSYGDPDDRRQLGKLKIISTRLPVSLPGLLARRG